METYERIAGKEKPVIVRRSLRTRDREVAKQRAEETALELRRTGERPAGDLTLRQLFDLYLRDVTPRKGIAEQQHDRSALQLMIAAIGADRRARTVSGADVARFTAMRARGDLTAVWRGRPRILRPAGARAIQRDLQLLRAVCAWATRQGDRAGIPLLERNPLAGMKIPGEEHPSRPILRDDEYRDMLEAAWALEKKGAGASETQFETPPILYVLLLTLAHETGHRIGAIARLKWGDVSFDRLTITWRKENDKIGMDHTTPLTPPAIVALERARRWAAKAAPIAFIFQRPYVWKPAPYNAEDLKTIWGYLERASKIERIPGRGWHSLRRKFATELKDAPAADVAQLGGWKNKSTLLRYQLADDHTMRTTLERRDPGKTGGKAVDVHPSNSPRNRDRASADERKTGATEGKRKNPRPLATLRPRQSSTQAPTAEGWPIGIEIGTWRASVDAEVQLIYFRDSRERDRFFVPTKDYLEWTRARRSRSQRRRRLLEATK